AQATLVLTPVPNPAAYGLVETDAGGRVTSFIEKPSDASQITTDTINAGIYVLETSTLALMPAGENHSIERGFFPALLRRGDPVVWEGGLLEESASIDGALLGAGVRVGRHARLAPGAFLGDGSVVSDHSRTH